MSAEDIAKRIAAITAMAAARATVIAVSKQQPAGRISAALAAGQRHFGENRVQEAKERWAGHRTAYPDLVLHMIGPLQTNKVRDAVALFDRIHTLDRPKLADVLVAEMKRQNRFLPCLIQVNTGDEPQKAGISPAGVGDLLAHCRAGDMTVDGLMCIPPVAEDPVPHFTCLAALARTHGLEHLSMGMSNDYEAALECGATFIRVGSGIFGARDDAI